MHPASPLFLPVGKRGAADDKPRVAGLSLVPQSALP